jgi:hypothetical protein
MAFLLLRAGGWISEGELVWLIATSPQPRQPLLSHKKTTNSQTKKKCRFFKYKIKDNVSTE